MQRGATSASVRSAARLRIRKLRAQRAAALTPAADGARICCAAAKHWLNDRRLKFAASILA
jgi:hypothetical protein